MNPVTNNPRQQAITTSNPLKTIKFFDSFLTPKETTYLELLKKFQLFGI